MKRTVACKRRKKKKISGLLRGMLRSEVNVVHTLTDPLLKKFTVPLNRINRIFRKYIDGMPGSDGNDVFAFYVRAYSFWESGVRLWASGRLPESYCLFRAALEHAAYGYRLKFATEELAMDWAERFKDKGKHREQFTWSKAKSSLQDLEGLFDLLYSAAIDMGAHPNPAGVLMGFEEAGLNGKASTVVAYQGAKLNYVISTGIYARMVGLVILDSARLCNEEWFECIKGTEVLAALYASSSDAMTELQKCFKSENEQENGNS